MGFGDSRSFQNGQGKMSQQWFCAINGQPTGPHDVQQVRDMAANGKLGPRDLVRREGMAEWAAVGSVPGLLHETAARSGAAPLGPAAAPVDAPSAAAAPFAQPAGM